MKIAIYHNLPSGGGKRALYEMTRRLAQDHEVDVYTLSCAEHAFCDLRPYARRHVVFPFAPLPLARFPFGRLNQGIRAVDLMRLKGLQHEIARQIDAAGYDVVFVHHCQFGQSPSLLQFLVTPSVYYCAEPPRLIHEPQIPRPYTQYSLPQRVVNLFDPFPALYRNTLAKFDRANVRAASFVLANSAYTRESLYRVYGIFARVCYLGVDTQLFRPLELPKADFVLSVGALNPHKGFDFLLLSLAKMDVARRPPLVIVSNFAEPREQGYLEDLARRLGVSLSIRVLVSDDELVRLYNQAGLTLYAPIMEPFGFVPLESMACGTPVVGVREAGVRETVLHNETGILTDRDPQQFAEAVQSLLNDEDRCRQYGLRGRAYVEERWSWEQSVQRLGRYLQQVAEASR